MIACIGVYGTKTAMAAVAQKAWCQILRFFCTDLFYIVFIADQRTGYRHTIRLSFGNEFLNEIGIPEATHRRNDGLDATLFEFLRKQQIVRCFWVQVVTVHMGKGTIPTANLPDVHQAFAHLAVVQTIFHGIAGSFFLGRNLGFDQKILSTGLLDPMEQFHGQGCPFSHGFATVLIRPLIQQRRKGAGMNTAPVGHIDGDHVESDLFQFHAGMDKVLNHSLQTISRNAGFVIKIHGIVAGHGYVVPVGGIGNVYILRLHCHQRCRTQGSVGVDALTDFPILLLHLRVIHTAGCHTADIPLAVRKRTNTHGNGCRTVSGQMLIECPCQFRLLGVRRNALGIKNTVLQCHIADFNG